MGSCCTSTIFVIAHRVGGPLQWDHKLLVWVETAFHEIDFTEAPEVAGILHFFFLSVRKSANHWSLCSGVEGSSPSRWLGISKNIAALQLFLLLTCKSHDNPHRFLSFVCTPVRSCVENYLSGLWIKLFIAEVGMFHQKPFHMTSNYTVCP